MPASGLRLILAPVVTGATLLAAVASAPAKPGYEVERKGFVAELRLEADNGYEVQVKARGNGTVQLATTTVTRQGALFFVAYRTRGRVTRDRIAARLGKLGRIDVSLDPEDEAHSGPGILPGWFCKGRDPIVREGVWRGRISFRGEHGYTRVAANEVAGRTTRRFRRVCGFRPGERSTFAEEDDDVSVLLRAVRRADGRTVEFEATEDEEAVDFMATVAEQREGMRIERVAYSFFAEYPGLFSIGPRAERPRAARAEPSVPFAGWADFRSGTGSGPVWEGPLRVPLPGLGMTPLAGPGFVPFICEAPEEDFHRRCPS
ncbi:MAG: hypothetical protein ABW196_04480 [Solirubrobacterales bacterium]